MLHLNNKFIVSQRFKSDLKIFAFWRLSISDSWGQSMKDHNHMEKAKTEGIKIHVSEPLLAAGVWTQQQRQESQQNKIQMHYFSKK